jgi:multiple sugar transport system permease protein
VAATAVRPRRRGWRHAVAQSWVGYAFASPWIVGFFLFTLGPMLTSFYWSFTDYSVLMKTSWVGPDNYVKMFTDDEYFTTALWNTTYYSVASVVLIQVIAMMLALLLNRDVRGVRTFRTVYYMPSVVSGVALSLLWLWLLDPDVGPINSTLWSVFGIEGPRWLKSLDWSKPSLILMSLWGAGNTVVLYLAALQGVPQELHEAAQIDGASSFRRFFSVTVPMISPTILFTLVLGIIGSFQVFTQAYVMTDGGPLNSTLMYVLYLYRTGFRNLFMGYASAMAWLLFLFILLMTALVFRSSPLWVYYEGRRANR